MKITDAAKEVLTQILEENQADGLLVEIQETCCGKSPVFAIARFEEGDEPIDVDGIKMVVPDEAREDIENVVIELSDGELIVANAVCGCGGHGHGGCGDHDHEGGCCGGHHHHD